MKKKRKLFVALVTVCALVMGSFAVPSAAAVDAVSEGSGTVTESASPAEGTAAPESEAPTILREDISLRGEYEKHFLMSDGTYQVEVYSQPVHELVDGEWVEIQNTNQNARDSVGTDTTKSNIIDNYVLQGYGVQNKSLDRLYIGNRSAGLTRAYIQFAAMPTIPEGSTITGAIMTLHFTSGTSTAANASAYQVTGGEWTSGTIQWSNKPAADVLLHGDIGHNNVTGYTVNCLTAVQHWYDGDSTGQNENYGIMLRYYDETTADYNAVYSADYSVESKRPKLVITYKDPSISILEGYTHQLSVSGVSDTVTWSSSNTAVATVNSSGVVTGVNAGQATVTASVGGTVHQSFTVYVKVQDSVYRIGFSDSDWYLGTNHGIADHTSVKILPLANTSIEQARQLWKVTYLGSGYYSIRPMCKPDMVLHLENGFVDIVKESTVESDGSSSLWTIEYDTDGYLFKYGGESSNTMWVSSAFPYANVKTTSYSSANTNFKWDLSKENSITNEVLLINTETGASASKATRYVASGETVTLEDVGIAATFMCAYNTDQSITWSTAQPSIVSVNSATGAVTGLKAGGTATIVATHTYNGLEYSKYYTVHVAQDNIPVFRIVHYYDIGYNVRESDAKTAIQSYHNAVAAKFESIFDLSVIDTIELCTSLCDQCKMQRYGTVSLTHIDSGCGHSPQCLNTMNLRADLFSVVSRGDELSSVVIWTGHRMTDYENDRSNSVDASNSVVMTTYGIDNWDDATGKYANRTNTLFHELSHQLGAPDHYCYNDASGEGDKCSNTYCDMCAYGYLDIRKCIMGSDTTISETNVYCSDCMNTITEHIEDHHYPLEN